MNILLIIVGFLAGLLSSSIGFGGGMVLLPVVTTLYGVEVAVPICTIAQLLSNASRSVFGWKSIEWKKTLWFLLPSIPLTALGAYGFSIAPKNIMTCIVGVALILFAIQKLRGKLHFPKGPKTMIVGGCVTGFINGLLSISGPLSSAVFLTLDLSPVAYIASEATAATVMHVVKIFVYGKLNLVNMNILTTGLAIAAAMIVGNYLAMRFIKHVDRRKYQKVVAGCMIILSLFLIISSAKTF
ncbi:MAG: sulfite exporter TauE/SafE family protein [Prevotella sp.]|jgi:uncharacterized membrane protein YfcA